MVDGQERQRMGEMAEAEAGGGGERAEGPGSWHEGPSARADTPRPDDGRPLGNQRGGSEGFVRSGSGKSMERAARKEVRWSKDVDYEG